jgi:hypothetical protein
LKSTVDTLARSYDLRELVSIVKVAGVIIGGIESNLVVCQKPVDSSCNIVTLLFSETSKEAYQIGPAKARSRDDFLQAPLLRKPSGFASIPLSASATSSPVLSAFKTLHTIWR